MLYWSPISLTTPALQSMLHLCVYFLFFPRFRANRIGRKSCMVKVTTLKGNFDHQLIIQIIIIGRSTLINFLHKYADSKVLSLQCAPNLFMKVWKFRACCRQISKSLAGVEITIEILQSKIALRAQMRLSSAQIFQTACANKLLKC